MSRSLLKSWDNRRERRINGRYNSWNRRVRWYEDDLSIRLCFEDEVGLYNKVYNRKLQEAEAELDWKHFRDGEPVTVWLNGMKTTTQQTAKLNPANT